MSTIYKLKYPLEWDSGEGKKLVEEIEIKRPKGKHLKKLGGDLNLGDVMGIMHHLTEYTDKFFDELDGADYMAVTEIVMGFLDSGQETGKK